jgi:hypothetical protein
MREAMTSPVDLRRLLLRALLVAAVVAGAAAVLALARDDFTDTDLKTIATSLLFGLASTLAAAGVAARGDGGSRGAALLGTVTVIATGTAFVLVTAGLWSDADGDGFWRPAACLGVVALEGAHASYVVARRGRDDPATARVAGLLAVGAAALSAVLVLVPTSGLADDDLQEGYRQFLGVVLVVQIVSTIVAALARRLGGTVPERPLLAPEDPADRLRRGVLAAADRIEQLADDPRVRAECERLRDLARTREGVG